MILSPSRIRIVFLITALFPCLSCTADALKITPGGESGCVAIKQLLDPLHIFLDDKMIFLLAQSTEEIAYDVTPELRGQLTSLIACSTSLTELELRDKYVINRERCDPFPIVVTLSGLEESLKELVECRTQECTPDEIALKKEVMQLQMNRLKMLAGKCSES